MNPAADDRDAACWGGKHRVKRAGRRKKRVKNRRTGQPFPRKGTAAASPVPVP